MRSPLGARATTSFLADAELPDAAGGGLDVAAADACGLGAGALALVEGAGALAVDLEGAVDDVVGAVL